MNKYRYLILVEVGDTPYLCMADHSAPERGFVEFYEGSALLLGRIVLSNMVAVGNDTWNMFAAMKPIFEAEEIYGSCYKRKEDAGHAESESENDAG